MGHFLGRRIFGAVGALLVFFCNFASAEPFAYIGDIVHNTVSVIDTATNALTATIPVGSNPWGVAVNPAGSLVYVTNHASDTVSVINAATNAVAATVPVGRNPVGVAVNPAGSRVYVANWSANSVSVIDTASNAVIATIATVTPVGIAINSAGTFVYVANSSNDTVSVISTATNRLSATIPVGTHPYGVAINPAGTFVYVSNGLGFAGAINSIAVVSTATNTVTATIPFAEAPGTLAVDPAGGFVYVANSSGSSRSVSIISTATNTVTGSLSVGDIPSGVALSPDGRLLYVVTTDAVSVFNTATHTLTASLTVGPGARVFGQFIGPSIAAVSVNEYAVKFVCGEAAPGVVAKGTYFTAINVHNPSGERVTLFKKFAIALPGEKAGPVSASFAAKLGTDEAFEIDCPDILKHLKAPPAFVKGFVLIKSPRELDVVGVYTAAGSSSSQVQTLALERVLPRKTLASPASTP